MSKVDVRVPGAPPISQRTAFNTGLKDAKSRQASKITSLRGELVSNGYDTLQKQAAVLGISRSTAWYLLNGDYKGSGLSANTVKRILSSTTLPAAVRELIQEYVEQKLLGTYGHDGARLKVFRKRLGFQFPPVAPTPPER